MVWKKLPEDPQVPPRIVGKEGRGYIGEEIGLITNFYTVTFKNSKVTLYHFDVEIQESKNLKAKDLEKLSLSDKPKQAAVVGLPPPEAAGGAKKKRRNRNKKNKKTNEGDDGEGEEEGGATAVVEEAAQPAAPVDPDARDIPKNKKRKLFLHFITKEKAMIFKDHSMTFDGEKSAFAASCPNQLRGGKVDACFIYEDDVTHRKKQFTITMKLVAKKNLSVFLDWLASNNAITTDNFTVFQMLEVIFNYQRTLRFSTLARNRFFTQDDESFGRRQDLPNAKECVTGFFSTLRPAAGWKDNHTLLLNVDVAHTAFYKVQPLMGYLLEMDSYLRFDGSPQDNQKIGEIIMREVVKKDIRVQSTHQNYKRKYKVSNKSLATPKSHIFEITDDNGKTKKVNIVTYFQDRYKYTIKYPNLCCIIVGRDTQMPIEVCQIAPEQRVKGRLGPSETAEFIKIAAMKPNDRLDCVNKVVGLSKFETDPSLQHMGVQISQQPLSLKGRVLPAPEVYMKGKNITPNNGVWNLRGGEKFINSVNIHKWAIVNFTNIRDDAIMVFVKELIFVGRSLGMDIAQPLSIATPPFFKYKNSIQPALSEYRDYEMILCIIESTEVYEKVKNYMDRNMKVISQCIKKVNVFKCKRPTVQNLLFKINTKLGGINHTASYARHLSAFSQLFNKDNVLVVGADVNHPPAQDLDTPSLVAVVGSMEKTATKYAVEVHPQSHRTEVITNMKSIMQNLLMQFYFHSGKQYKPDRIIMYRDGVSESQFAEVLRSELTAIRDACLALDKSYMPAITFVCVQKRHHTRLYCDRSSQRLADRSGNVPAGTVLDHTITHRTEADFYLCSHQGIQGTSKPSHYHVLWDDSDFTMNQLQLMTYSLCHNYSRCARSVSIPTPVYYAHLAAFRAKVHLDGGKQNYEEDFLQDINAPHGTPGFSDETLNKHTKTSGGNQFSKIMYYV